MQSPYIQYITRPLLVLLLSILSETTATAHSSFDEHKNDFYSVLGFNENTRLTEWMRIISSDMIDKHRGPERAEYGGLNFYDYLKHRFPGFKCKHRLLFHWGYNSRPWTPALERKVMALSWSDNPENVKLFQDALVYEQKLRNAKANEYTEQLFDLSSSGAEAKLANALVSIVYDTHILGDYTPDNTDLEGLQSFPSVVGDIINSIRKIDADLPAAKLLVKTIQTTANDQSLTVPDRATRLLSILSDSLPDVLASAHDGAIARRFAKQGITFYSR